jgi:hypothetical protein
MNREWWRDKATIAGDGVWPGKPSRSSKRALETLIREYYQAFVAAGAMISWPHSIDGTHAITPPS